MVSQNLSGAFFTVTKRTVKKLGKKMEKIQFDTDRQFQNSIQSFGTKAE